MEELLEGLARGIWIPQVVLIDLADGEQSLKAILAPRILTAQKLIFANRTMKVFLSGRKLPPHFSQGLGDRDDAGVGLARHRRHVVDLAVGVGYMLIIFPRALAGGASVEGLPHLFGFVELVSGLLLAGRGGGKRSEADAEDRNRGSSRQLPAGKQF